MRWSGRWPPTPSVTALHAAPGNPGIGQLAERHEVTPTDPAAVTALAAQAGADLVVVGPEAPLVAGVADALRAAGIACFGPVSAAADDRGLQVVRQGGHDRGGHPHGRGPHLPDARARRSAALDDFGPPYVVKADGLAAGKGVVVTGDRAAALRHAADCGTVVIEEFLDGPEVSVFALCRRDRRRCRCCPPRTSSAPTTATPGPNTGGMGAYAPLPWAPAGLADGDPGHGRRARPGRAAPPRHPLPAGCSTPA